jgi:CheY-like chemotaxis protein
MKARVLIVEDEELVARATARTLREHEVTVALCVEEAQVILAGRSDFHCILLDMHMKGGGLQGPDLYDWVGSYLPDLQPRIILLHGGTVEPEDNAFLAQLADKNVVLVKPVRNQALRDAIGKHLS